MSPHHLAPTLASAIAVAVLGALAAPARAQHCHIDTPPRPTGAAAAPAVAITVGTRVTAGVARVPALTTPMMIERDYQGADLVVDVTWRRVTAEARLGAFRVADHGVGLDDLAAALAVRLTPRGAAVAVSALGGATLPTGDADAGRGMGHVMVAAGAAARTHRGRYAADATVTYARALGDGAAHATHAHGAELWPLIDPMGAEEVTVELGGAVAFGPRGLAVRASGLFGQPIAHGARRLITTGGVTYGRGRYQVGAALSVPAVSDAFITRGQLSLAYHY
ncbi:MAG: transporter [Myxococcales bacterium]|nr:transporter [Myxococcales bacterium]